MARHDTGTDRGGVGQRSLLSWRGVQDRVRRVGPAAAARPHPGSVPQTNGVIERFFGTLKGTLKYEHLFRGVITDGDTLDMQVHRFRIIYNTIRPHQALDDRVPSAAFNDCGQRKIAR
ncbi:integrase core domain-containing protein [Nocardia rhamnosiphila]|uniref:integrase core domain-containing protein n=1 Tax=Nocardia rhamnosiphila TaxID=426716 RepID=UPI003405AE80